MELASTIKQETQVEVWIFSFCLLWFDKMESFRNIYYRDITLVRLEEGMMRKKIRPVARDTVTDTVTGTRSPPCQR